MKVFTCTCFTGHWPVGTAAVVIADNQNDAALLLNGSLIKNGLPGDAEPEDIIELCEAHIVDSRQVGAVRILCNGDY
jgi:hypothetical protein